MATMTMRGTLIGANYVLDRLPAQAFKVRSWQNGVSPATQAAVRKELAKSKHKIEAVFDAKHRRYIGLVWASEPERRYCFNEWAAYQE